MKAGHGGAGASGSSRTRPSTIVEKAKLAFNVYDRNRDGHHRQMITLSDRKDIIYLNKGSSRITRIEVKYFFSRIG